MTQRIAALIRRHPFLMRLPYLFFRRFQSRYTVGVAAVVIDEAQRILMVEQAFHPRLPWGLPGGWLGGDEDPAAAVIRELEEELQLSASICRVLHVAKPVPNHIDIAFLCQPQGPVGRLNRELLNYRWLDRAQLPAIHAFQKAAIDIAFEQLERGRQ